MAEHLRQNAGPWRLQILLIHQEPYCTRLVPAPLVTARALAPLDKLLGLALPHLAENGTCLFPKGRTAEDELTAAKGLWHMTVERILSPLDRQASILKVNDLRHVGTEQTPPHHRSGESERRGR